MEEETAMSDSSATNNKTTRPAHQPTTRVQYDTSTFVTIGHQWLGRFRAENRVDQNPRVTAFFKHSLDNSPS